MNKLSGRLIIAIATFIVNEVNGYGQVSPVEADTQTTYIMKGGREVTAPGRYYRSIDGRVREDSPVGSMIVDIKAGTVTLLKASTKEAAVFKVEGGTTTVPPKTTDVPLAPFEQTVIDGRAVTKARATVSADQTREVWTATDIGLVVFSSVSTADLTSRKILSNVSVREPDPTVFQIPKDYRVTTQLGLPEKPTPSVRPVPPPPVRK